MPSVSELYAAAQERITVDATGGGVSLTLSNVISTPRSRAALITVETATIRWLSDGTAPTATTGNLSYAGDVIRLENPNELWNFRAIRTGSTSATIQVTYYR